MGNGFLSYKMLRLLEGNVSCSVSWQGKTAEVCTFKSRLLLLPKPASFSQPGYSYIIVHLEFVVKKKK